MSAKRRGTGAVPEVSESDVRYQRWVTRAYGFAAFCLAALAVVEITDTATPFVQTLLMMGIVLAGTAAWVMQAKRKCPQCDELYGYHFRIVNANRCRKCGAEFPRWRPGQTEEKADE
jgi:hypothetical protein